MACKDWLLSGSQPDRTALGPQSGRAAAGLWALSESIRRSVTRGCWWVWLLPYPLVDGVGWKTMQKWDKSRVNRSTRLSQVPIWDWNTASLPPGWGPAFWKWTLLVLESINILQTLPWCQGFHKGTFVYGQMKNYVSVGELRNVDLLFHHVSDIMNITFIVFYLFGGVIQ